MHEVTSPHKCGVELQYPFGSDSDWNRLAVEAYAFVRKTPILRWMRLNTTGWENGLSRDPHVEELQVDPCLPVSSLVNLLGFLKFFLQELRTRFPLVLLPS